jgi:hypothetical protein
MVTARGALLFASQEGEHGEYAAVLAFSEIEARVDDYLDENCRS